MFCRWYSDGCQVIIAGRIRYLYISVHVLQMIFRWLSGNNSRSYQIPVYLGACSADDIQPSRSEGAECWLTRRQPRDPSISDVRWQQQRFCGRNTDCKAWQTCGRRGAGRAYRYSCTLLRARPWHGVVWRHKNGTNGIAGITDCVADPFLRASDLVPLHTPRVVVQSHSCLKSRSFFPSQASKFTWEIFVRHVVV